LAGWFPEFAEHLDKMDETYALPWPSRPGPNPVS
jgi:hypothetical protein